MIWRDESLLKKISSHFRVSGRNLVLLAVLGSATGAIVFNAVVLQPARHPAPLFAAVDAARAVKEKPAAPVAAVAARPVREAQPAKQVEEKVQLRTDRPPVERPVEKAERQPDRIEKLIEKAEKPPVKSSQPAAPQKPLSGAAYGDALGELIRAGAVPPANIPAEPDARVMAIQKNLGRLGYAVGKADGMIGPGTRTAIEKFERDRKWQVTGEITSRLVRELGTVSAGKRD